MVYLSTHFIQAKEYLEAIITSSSDAIVTTDMAGRIHYFSPGAERLYGLEARAALGLPVSRLYSGGHAEAQAVMDRLVRQGSVTEYETAVARADGARTYISLSASLLRDRAGTLIGTLGIAKDITRRVELESRLRELTITDNLTGLYNQRHLSERLGLEAARARRQGVRLSLLVLDLDRFKEANDSWGHLEGDRILRETAAILRDSIRRDVDLAFRYGGDEFVLLFPGLGAQGADAVARRVQAAAAKRDFARIVTLSIGTATLKPRERPAELLRRADARMYAAKKRRNKNRGSDLNSMHSVKTVKI